MWASIFLAILTHKINNKLDLHPIKLTLAQLIGGRLTHLLSGFMPFRFHCSLQNQEYCSRYFPYVSLNGVSRVANGAAYCFVKWSLSYNFVASFGVNSCPPCLEAALEKDSGPFVVFVVCCCKLLAQMTKYNYLTKYVGSYYCFRNVYRFTTLLELKFAV